MVTAWRSTGGGRGRIQVYFLCTTGERPSQSSAKCSPLRHCVYYWRSMCADNHHCTETQLPVSTHTQYNITTGGTMLCSSTEKSDYTPLWIRFHSTCTRTDENGGYRRHQQRRRGLYIQQQLITLYVGTTDRPTGWLAGWQCLAAF